MKQRIDIAKLVPQAYDILLDMEKYLATTDLSLNLRELVKIRASQINKCAHCLDMHAKDARKAGESEQRIYALSAWEESALFTDAERAALSLTESITKISKSGVSDAIYEEVQKYFSDLQIAQLILVINQINFWNRLAVTAKKSELEV